MPSKRWPFVACSALVAAGLLAFAQTLSFAWDEGFHLLAAQLIRGGRRPYLDFVFAQAPLNAYWNAAWMRILGDGWRLPHALAAIESAAAVILAADFLRERFLQPAWSQTAMFAALILAGSNGTVVEFGTVAQAYGLCLLLIVAAFRAAVLSVEWNAAWPAALAGLLSVAAAESSLLTAPVAPVLLLWLFVYGSRKSVVPAFLTGAAIALLPVAALFIQSPARVIFGMFEYHMFYRRSEWPGATGHDLEVYASWIDYPQAIVLGALAAAGIWFIVRTRRTEFYLCGWLALAEGLFVSTAHPTFPRYYIFTVPFLSVLGAIGIYAISTRLGVRRAVLPVTAVAALVCLGMAKRIYERDYLTWHDMEKLAAQVDRVTAPGVPVYADEQIYFLSRRTPPPGNEYLSSHKLRLPPEQSALVHIVPQPEFDRKIAAGVFATLETCDGEDWITARNLSEVYRQKAEISGCTVFWEPAVPENTNAARFPARH